MKSKQSPRALTAAAVCVLFAFISCDEVKYAGSSRGGFLPFPKHKISPEKAHELARPHLDKLYKLRLSLRPPRSKKDPWDVIVVSGKWYYIARDNYPFKTMGAYLKNSVKVHVQTGKVIPPPALQTFKEPVGKDKTGEKGESGKKDETGKKDESGKTGESGGKKSE